jgi:autotransporter strand-loop-strand O-heptosyltransferase
VNKISVLGHTSFLGKTGYNSHSRNFFTHLNKHFPTRIRNYTYDSDLSYLSQKQYDMIIKQNWADFPFKIGTSFIKDKDTTYVNLVLNESHHYYFYDKYEHPMIAYNVWEATKQIPEYFSRILQYDQFWCPTLWQRQMTIDQGYPEDRVKVVPEGVDGKRFYPLFSNERHNVRMELCKKYNIPVNAFIYMVFGRWDYRKSITEIIKTFCDTFKDDEMSYLVISVDNPFPVDKMNSTEERLKHHGIVNPNIRTLHFPSDQEYTKWLQAGDCLVSCSRSEGWNLPLLEAISCGIPTICSNWSGQLEFADGVSLLVDVPNFKKPEKVFMLGDGFDIGVWGEPDFDHLAKVMISAKEGNLRDRAVKLSKYIREAYSWDNAALKAKDIIDDLLKGKYYDIPVKQISENEKVKLNLGCGNDIRPGYVNIDRFNNTGQVDLCSDFTVLPFKDESVDEIYTSHIFEHVSINDVYSVIDEWKRVLKIGGKLEIRVPDLEVEVKIWLAAKDEDKWFQTHRIYGSQSHPGNSHFCGFTAGSLKWLLTCLGLKVEESIRHHNGYGEEVKCVSTKIREPLRSRPTYNVHFVDGPFVEIRGDNDDPSFYLVDILDPDHNSSVHETTLRANTWTRPHRKYFNNYTVTIKRNGRLDYEHKFDLKGKTALISFDSKSLGDTIAWIPYAEEFRKEHSCKVVVSTFWNHLFEKHPTYSKLKFVSPGSSVNDLYASYTVGCYEGNRWKNKIDWRIVTLQQICSDTLGIEYKEIIPDIDFTPGKRPVEENIKYVTLSEFSTFQCKFWNYPDGWQKVIDYLNSVGYKVMVISKEETKLKNIINKTGEPLWNTMNNIYHSEFFMGVSAGPAWLSWTLRKPVVMISGCTKKIQEFESNLIRVINEDVCHGCINDVNNNFERGDWNYCPRQKGTDRQFECTKTITPDMVIEQMKELIK